MSTFKSTPNPRRKPTPVTSDETQAALDALVGAMTEDFVSPGKAIAPSAVQLLVRANITKTDRRASYILNLLVEAGAIKRIDNSHSYLVVRKSVAVGRTPVMPAADQEIYEETIRRLDSEIQDLRATHESELAKLRLELIQHKDLLVKANQFVKNVEAENIRLLEEKAKMEAHVSPPADVRAIMDRVLGS